MSQNLTWAPEPWVVEESECPGTWFDVDSPVGNCTICDGLSREEADRIVACVNAMEGIRDPKALMDAARVVARATETLGSEIVDALAIELVPMKYPRTKENQ